MERGDVWSRRQRYKEVVAAQFGVPYRRSSRGMALPRVNAYAAMFVAQGDAVLLSRNLLVRLISIPNPEIL